MNRPEVKKKMSGKNSGSYIHGMEIQIARRDNYICQKCGKRTYKGACHHIHYNKKDSRFETLVYLHRGCNSIVNFNRDYWFSYFCHLKNIKPEILLGGD